MARVGVYLQIQRVDATKNRGSQGPAAFCAISLGWSKRWLQFFLRVLPTLPSALSYLGCQLECVNTPMLLAFYT
jgi:hypothetical protein